MENNSLILLFTMLKNTYTPPVVNLLTHAKSSKNPSTITIEFFGNSKTVITWLKWILNCVYMQSEFAFSFSFFFLIIVGHFSLSNRSPWLCSSKVFTNYAGLTHSFILSQTWWTFRWPNLLQGTLIFDCLYHLLQHIYKERERGRESLLNSTKWRQLWRNWTIT